MHTRCEGRKKVLNVFKSGIFVLPLIEDAGLKISNPEEMFQGLPVALVQIKAGNSHENVLNEIHQIIFSIY